LDIPYLYGSAFPKPGFRVGPITIAIDGYSSCGKSTLARALASELNYVYVDSGAMYRAVTLAFLRQHTPLQDNREVESVLASLDLHFNSSNHILLNEEEVEQEIRGLEVSNFVSEVAAVPRVRQEMLKQQRVMGQQGGIVMDGRDIGTAVFPEAELKIFLTASPEIRTQRRYKELQGKGISTSEAEVSRNLRERDRIDTSRDVNPLRMASDAILLDNSNLNEAEQLAMVLALAKVRIHANS
jgi:cytidylate kinase